MGFYFGGWVEEKGDAKGSFKCYLYPGNMKNVLQLIILLSYI